MTGARDYLAGLAQLHEIENADERVRAWRQGLASLAMAATNQRAAPLEALRPERLLESVRVATATGLLDDTKWMSPGQAASAFFEIASVLPPGDEKRDLGRRVLQALLMGDAATFALLATSLASTSRRGLSTPPLRARLSVAARLPIGIETGVDRLALAVLCRPDLEREWLIVPSTGTLPARRLAARLLERAAREAVRRSHEGDDLGSKTFRRPTVRAAWDRLLADRESLVWRHAATARGLLSAVDETLATEIVQGLSPRLTPTEWRRAVAALGASVAHAPTSAVARCQELIEGDLLRRDPGLGATLIFGLSRAATLEPEAVEALLPLLLEGGNLESVEAFVDLLAEHPGWRQADRITAHVLDRLRASPAPTDDGLAALRRALDAELSPLGSGRRPSVRHHITAAQMAFVEGRDLRPDVEAALGSAGLGLGILERLREDGSESRQRAYQILRELDRGLLESSLLADLLVMAGIDPASRASGDLGGLILRLRAWLLRREEPSAAGPVPHIELARRRLRALVHAIDGEGYPLWDESVTGTRDRRLHTVDRLLIRLAVEAPLGLRRPISAALARACEGLVRDEVAEVGELVLLLGARLRAPEDFVVLSEATLGAELKDVFTAMAELARRLGERGNDGAVRAAFAALGEVIPPGLTAPVEGLRRTLVLISRALDRIASARSLLGLALGTHAGSLERLAELIQDLVDLGIGVWRRLGQPPPGEAATAAAPLRALEGLLVQAARGAAVDLQTAVNEALAAVRVDLPHTLAEVVARALGRLPALPLEAAETGPSPEAEGTPQLPNWLPPSRVLGGFYVQRPVGRGTAGSVFVVCRAEERHDANPERFALKVPFYDGSVAHTLSEEEFLRLFREEASSLLTLPTHPNLAAFVTFDARARPKPVLVMELIEGPTLERLLERRDLTVSLVLSVLDGVAAGLETLHALGIGHLDVKPANVILRVGSVPSDSAALPLEAAALPPVLVDFGLAGRKVRPGCASPFYGAPEVWVTEGQAPPAEPAPADVYSYCCVAYELLTSQRLFAGDTLAALVAAHFAHDGQPEGIARLREDPLLAPLADALSLGLRADPRRRASIRDLRAALSAAVAGLPQDRWPIMMGPATVPEGWARPRAIG